MAPVGGTSKLQNEIAAASVMHVDTGSFGPLCVGCTQHILDSRPSTRFKVKIEFFDLKTKG